jgi:acetyl esterase
MVLDPRAKRLLDMLSLSRIAQSNALTIDERRSGFSQLMQMGARPPAKAEIRDIVANGRLHLRIYRTTTNVRPAALVFFHGGGLVAGSIETHDGTCRALARHSEITVISVGYRLAPEHKFPASLDDARFAIDWIAGHSDDLDIDATRLAIGGDSAGALLAALICSDQQLVTAEIRAQLLLCPVIDLVGELPSRRKFATGYLIDASTVEQDIRHCLAEDVSPASLPSPLRSVMKCLPPPTIIVAAEYDPFRDEAASYSTLLQEAGVPVRYNCYAGMVHSFYGLPAFLPQADAALAEAGQILAEFLG